jgi:hypothetical protein
MAKRRHFCWPVHKCLIISVSLKFPSPNCHKKPVEIFMSVIHIFLVQKNLQLNKQQTQGANLMKLTVTRLAAASLLAALSLTSSYAGGIAQPTGIFTVPVVGPNKLNLLATPFSRPVVAEGTISAQTGSVLNVSAVPAMTGGLPYVLEVQDGDYIGVIALVTASTGDANGGTVTVQYSFPAGAITSGTRYAILPDWTISTLFGPAATSQVGSSTSYGGGDVLQIFNPASQKLENFWRQRTGTSPNFNYAWLTQSGQPAENVRVPMGEGFIIKRFSSTTLNLRLSGELRQTRTRKEILGNGKLNIVANPNPYPVKLSQSGLTPTAGTTPGASDNIHFIDPNTGRFISYYRKSNSGSTWFSAAGVPADDVTIPAGGALIYQRGSTRGDLTGRSAARLNPLSFANAPGI